MPYIQLSKPYLRLLGPACVSPAPQPVKRILRMSALSSPLLDFRNSVCGGCVTMTPPLEKHMLVGKLSLSAKTENLSATPSPSVSSQMTILSLPLPSGCRLFG